MRLNAARLALCVMTLLLLSSSCGAQGQTAFPAEGYLFAERAVERIIIVLFGGISMYLGFALFRISTESAGEILAKGGSYSLQMSRIGPGIFFALFGAFILVYALYEAPKIEATSNGTKTSISGVTNSDGVASTDSRDLIKALNTIDLYINSYSTPSDPAQKTLAVKMLATLEPMRRDLIDKALGIAGAYNEWKALNDLRPVNPAEVESKLKSDNGLARRFNDVERLINTTETP